MASSLTSAFVRDVSSPKRVSWGGTRVNAGRKNSTDSTSRVRIFKDDLEKWKTLKLATGKVSDQDFCHFLLELAEKSIQTSYDGHFSSPVNVRSEFMQSLLPQSLTSTPVTSTPISHDTIHKVPSRSLFSQDSTSVRAAEVTSCSLSKTLALRDDYESSESDDESSDDERTLSVICDNDDSVADYDTEIETNCDSSADSDCDERFETEPGCQSAGIQAEDPSVDQEFDEIRHKRIIVSIANLKQLFPSHCSIAECSNKLYNTAKLIGSSLKVTSTCTAGHVTQWSSSDPHYDKKNSAINENDLLFAASILFSGNHYAKISQFCSILGLACITEAMFYRYQKLYLIPTVEKFWTQHITSIKEKFAHKELIASGDGRCDSPGSSAKFCTYSMMSETGEVVELQTVDKREVNFKSPLMECEGLKRCLDNIAANSTMKVKELTTDASITVIAMMRDKYPSIVHSLDVWHKAKKLKKSLSQAGKKKGYEKINMWSDQICNHFWYCCKECNGDVEKLESMWISVLHHVQNEHVWILGKCDHILNDGTDTSTEPPTDCDGTVIPYFLPNEPAMEALRQIVLDQKWLKSLKFYVRFRHTGNLECFHSLMLAYCPKRIAFKDEAFRARMYLAAIDHNFHLGRNPSRNVSGEEQNHRVFRKRTNRWDVVPVFKQKSYDYMPILIDTLYKYRADCDASIRSTVIKRYNHPEKISATLSKRKPPSTSELVKAKKSRFTEQS